MKKHRITCPAKEKRRAQFLRNEKRGNFLLMAFYGFIKMDKKMTHVRCL